MQGLSAVATPCWVGQIGPAWTPNAHCRPATSPTNECTAQPDPVEPLPTPRDLGVGDHEATVGDCGGPGGRVSAWLGQHKAKAAPCGLASPHASAITQSAASPIGDEFSPRALPTGPLAAALAQVPELVEQGGQHHRHQLIRCEVDQELPQQRVHGLQGGAEVPEHAAGEAERWAHPSLGCLPGVHSSGARPSVCIPRPSSDRMDAARPMLADIRIPAAQPPHSSRQQPRGAGHSSGSCTAAPAASPPTRAPPHFPLTSTRVSSSRK